MAVCPYLSTVAETHSPFSFACQGHTREDHLVRVDVRALTNILLTDSNPAQIDPTSTNYVSSGQLSSNSYGKHRDVAL